MPKLHVLTILAGILIIIIPFLFYLQQLTGINFPVFVTFFVMIILLSFYVIHSQIIQSRMNVKSHISIDILDILIIAYLLYGTINIIFVNKWIINSEIWLKWAAVFCSYIFFKAIALKNVILHFFIISGIIQSIIALAQITGNIDSNHNIFNVTGCFSNPAQLGGYIALSFVAAAIFLHKSVFQKKKLLSIYLGCCLILLSIALYLSDSRAAILATLSGLFLAGYPYILKRITPYKHVLIPLLLMVIFVASILLFNYRPESIKGRFFIWQISFDMIRDAPCFGHGINSFTNKYMLYQADFFKTNTDSIFLSVADDIVTPFNEFIHIIIEQGLFGIVLFGIILYIFFLTKISSNSTRISKALACSLLVFSFFSYPSEVFPLLLLFAIILSIDSIKPIIKLKLNNLANYISLLILTLILGLGINQIRLRNIDEINIQKMYTNENTEDIKNWINKRYYNLIHRYSFMKIYPYWLKDNNLTDNSWIIYIRPSYDNYCEIGQFYCQENNTLKAEYFFEMASYMIPSRIKADYLLWQLHIKNNASLKAYIRANRILKKPLKVENTYTLRVKAELRDYIKLNQNLDLILVN